MSDLKIAPVNDSKSESEGISNSNQLLILVLDVNSNQPFVMKNPGKFLTCLDATFAFANSHLMLHPNNKLAVITAHTQSCTFIYPRAEEVVINRHLDGQFEGFSNVENILREGVKNLLFQETVPNAPVHSDSLLSGALSMALCYINRQRNEESQQQSARILVMSASGDTTSQYMNYMNVFFSAQKMNVPIDSILIDKESGLLQQGADITSGFYHRIEDKQIPCLLEYLYWMYLPNHELRKDLILPSAEKVDYRAACFCDRQLIDVGFVCSVCLSIFCKLTPICSTCHTVFKVPGPPRLPGGGKRKRSSIAPKPTNTQ